MNKITSLVSLALLANINTTLADYPAHQGSDNQSSRVQNQAISALEEEILWLKEETYVSTATKTLEDISKSGATVSVITAADLKNMGARNLMDALKRIPGIGINAINIGIPSIEVRGVKTEYSEKVLFLVNGHSINNNLVNGGATWSHNNFMIDEIKRVEIVRGPGSALYGANAFVAVINIITKESKDINGTILTSTVGSNDTQKINIQTGRKVGTVNYALNLNFFNTDGFREVVQTDAVGSTGETDDWNRRFDLGFNLRVSNFSLQGKYLKRKAGSYAGFFNALNDESKQEYTEYFLELGYSQELSDNFTVSSKISHDHFEANNFWELLSESATFPNGMLAKSPATNEKISAEIQIEYKLEQHKFLAGLMTEHHSQFDIDFEANFDPATGAPLPGGYQNIYATSPWNISQNTDIHALFVQDIWDIHKDIRAIVGARYDHYSDFKGTFNPRSSLSWEFQDNYTFIATYGSAFRAPTFGEVYNSHNPIVVGNLDLDPEEIETYELGVNGELNKRTHFRLTGFRNNISDLINNASGAFDNAGKLEVNGVEVEFKSRLRNGSSFNLNYTYQYAVNKLTDHRAPDVPMHKVNASFNYRHSQYFSSYIGISHRGQLKRMTDGAADNRSDIADFITVDVAANWNVHPDKFELKASIYNLFDEEYVDPAKANTVASDFPQPGRNILLEASYKL